MHLDRPVTIQLRLSGRGCLLWVAMLARWMVLSTRFSIREFKCACVKVFALCIAAVSLIKSDAESFVAVLLHKIGSFDLLCSPIAWRFVFARLCALLAFLSSGVALH